LNPDRLRLIELLETPDFASGLARRLKVARQLVNYHLKELESAELVEVVEERKKGNCIERMLRAKARYVISPVAVGKRIRQPQLKTLIDISRGRRGASDSRSLVTAAGRQ